MGAPVDVAVVGAGSVAGRAVLERLVDDAPFALGELCPLDGADAAGSTIELGGRELELRDAEAFDFSRVRLAIFCGGRAMAARHVPAALDAGSWVIDTSSHFRDDPDVPLVIPELNPEAMAGIREGGLVACPSAASVQLLLALAPLHRAAGIVRAEVFSCEAASGAGAAALEELGSQTAALLNFRDAEPRIFPRQLAFNLLPQVGAFDEGGWTSREVKMSRESRRILGDAALQLNVTAVRVPVFYGHAQAVHLQTRDRLGADEARELLRGSPAIAILDEQLDGGYPTAVTEASGQDAVFVGRVREDRSRERGLNLWIVADNLRRGVAATALGCARIAVGDYL